MKMISKIKIILLSILFTSVGYAGETSSFLAIAGDFSFTALSGHKINYSKADDTLSVLTPNGETLALGRPSRMRVALSREGCVQHSFSVYSTSEGESLEYTMILRTKLEASQNTRRAIGRGNDYVDTQVLDSTGFWITDLMTQKEILTSSLSEGAEEISKVISVY